jgi:thioredoxin-dependent peroxiredoxin
MAKKAQKKPSSKKASSTMKATKKLIKKVVKSTPLKVGEKVKNFNLESTGEREFKLSQQAGRITVLYFYPKDATPGCTLEGQEFTRLNSEFKKSGADIFGVSRDTIKSHQNFKTKQNYSVELLSDVDEKACSIFGVIKEKNMYGKKVLGIERSTFVIDQSGRLVKEWRGVKVPGHAEEVLEFVKTL